MSLTETQKASLKETKEASTGYSISCLVAMVIGAMAAGLAAENRSIGGVVFAVGCYAFAVVCHKRRAELRRDIAILESQE